MWRDCDFGFWVFWSVFAFHPVGAAAGQEGTKADNGSLSPGWNLMAMPLDGVHDPDASAQPLPNDTPVVKNRGYWVYADADRAVESWWVDSSTTASGGWQFLSVAESTPYEDLRFSRVYRWDGLKAGYVPLVVGDVLEPDVGYFGYGGSPISEIGSKDGDAGGIMTDDRADLALETSAVEKVSVEVAPRGVGRSPGAFGPSEVLFSPSGPAAQVDVSLSAFGGRIYAHLVHLVRGQKGGEGDQILYHRSEKAGKPGTFESAQSLMDLGSSSSVISVAIAARDHRLSVAWVEQQRAPEGAPTGEGPFRVLVAESHDAGASFGPIKTVRANDAWKRGVDVGYDASLGHHLVWGEANKIYYLRNLSGEASNVFDVLKRSPATEVVKYLAEYEPDKKGQCGCPECWCEESYVVSGERDPSKNSDAVTAYVFRTEESYVYEPSLHVGDTAVSVVARQRRMWDNQPVGHAAWDAMLLAPVYDETVVQGLRPTRLVVGWKSTWKESYEPGDEFLFDGLGIQHQYRYRGTWYEQDEIRLAQRPLVSGSWTVSAATAEGAQGAEAWREDSWRSDTFHSWRMSTLAVVGVDEGNDTPSHPAIAEAPWGLAVVYEDGPSDDPNREGFNAIQFCASVDGGRSWSEPRRVATGYMASLAISRDGRAVVSSYEPGSAVGGTVSVVHSNDDATSFGAPFRLNIDPAKPIHWKSHGRTSDALVGGASTAVFEDLFFVAWIEKSDAGDQIVFSRASRASDVVHYGVDLPEYVTEGRASQVRVTAENVYHMRVASSGSAPSPMVVSWSTPGALGASAASARTVSLVEGEATLSVHLFDALTLGDGGMVSFAVAGAPGSGLSGDVERDNVEASVVPAFAASVHGNYKKALWLRDKLWRQSTEGHSSVGFQVEYEAAIDGAGPASSAGKVIDSVPLAGYERVWAYTQGIALAQYARQGTPESELRAQGLARYLCSQAEKGAWGRRGAGTFIRGWSFSWNTLGDDWRDVRLVTGATAWVTHGLGVFVISNAFSGLPDEDQDRIRSCYHQALHGLMRHQRAGETDEGRRVSLVTAGWTRLGLAVADNPSALRRPGPSGAMYGVAGESWNYYDVLDALGYNDFDEDSAPTIRRTIEGVGSQSTLPPLVLTKKDFDRLKEEGKATNIVTEHNLDVLSVLNHALNHSEALAFDARGPLVLSEMETLRDELRAGIFHVLWDDQDRHWRRDLERAAQSPGAGAQKREEIEAALERGDWGRVATGGRLVRGPKRSEEVDAVFVDDGPFRGSLNVIPNRRHTAIDNCSWLSLSVDFDDLTNADEVERLARCLEFTTLAFAKEIEFEGKRYYGAHYFFDGFEDKYIEGTSRQEQSFHLEATTGLILGLLAFVEAHPEHPKRDFFVREAYALWAGVQAFVLDHGFPYSSQRIVNLSTLLTSSTALIWFIDVYEQFERLGPAVTENNPWLAAHPSCRDRFGIGCPSRSAGLPTLAENRVVDFLLQVVDNDKIVIGEGGLHQANTQALKGVIRKPGRSLFGAFRELVKADPAFAAAAVPFVLPITAMTGDLDSGLTTMVAFNKAPGAGWRPAGSIAADKIIQEIEHHEYQSGVALFYKDEAEIRAHQTYQTTGGISKIFRTDLIYGFDTSHIPDLIPPELTAPKDSMLGTFFPDSPQVIGQNERIQVWILDTEKSRDEVIDTFLRHHAWWQNLLNIAEHIPNDTFRNGLLNASRGFLLGWFFDAPAAELAAGIPQRLRRIETAPDWWKATAGFANLNEKRSGISAAGSVDETDDSNIEPSPDPKRPDAASSMGLNPKKETTLESHSNNIAEPRGAAESESGSLPADLRWKYVGDQYQRMSPEKTAEAMSTPAGFRKIFPEFVMLENVEALESAGELRLKTKMVFIVDRKDPKGEFTGRSFSMPEVTNFKYTRFHLTPAELAGWTRIAMYEADAFDGTDIMEAFGLKDGGPSVFDEFVKTSYKSSPVRLAATPMSDRALFHAKLRVFGGKVAILAYHPQRGYAAFHREDEKMWGKITAWGPDTVLVSYPGVTAKNRQNERMDHVFKKLTHIQYVRVPMPDGTVRFYNRKARWVALADDHWSSDPLAAYQQRVEEAELAFAKTPEILSKPLLERFDATGFYRQPVPLTDAELQEAQTRLAPNGVLIQVRRERAGEHNEDVYFVFNPRGGRDRRPYADTETVFLGAAGNNTEEEERSFVQWLLTQVDASWVSMPYARMIRGGYVRYYNGGLNIELETSLSDSTFVAYQEDVQAIREKLPPSIREIKWRALPEAPLLETMMEKRPSSAYKLFANNDNLRQIQQKWFLVEDFRALDELGTHWLELQDDELIFLVEKRIENKLIEGRVFRLQPPGNWQLGLGNLGPWNSVSLWGSFFKVTFESPSPKSGWTRVWMYYTEF